MPIVLSLKDLKSNFVRKIAEISGENVFSCYQCGMCSSSCPSTDQMDVLPNELIRLVQLGRENEVLNSKTIWVCSSCFACKVECPRGLDIAQLAEALRLMHLRRDVDHLDLDKIPQDELEELPPIALVGTFSKYTA